MKRSLFIAASASASAALALAPGRFAPANARVRGAAVRRLALGRAHPAGGCSTHRSGLRWSGFTRRELAG
jgi:hypothetical protein